MNVWAAGTSFAGHGHNDSLLSAVAFEVEMLEGVEIHWRFCGAVICLVVPVRDLLFFDGFRFLCVGTRDDEEEKQRAERTREFHSVCWMPSYTAIAAHSELVSARGRCVVSKK